MYFIFYLLIGAAAGWLAGQLMKGSSMGLVNNMILGVVGSMVGGMIFRLFGLSLGGLTGSLITATAGASLLLFLAGKFLKK